MARRSYNPLRASRLEYVSSTRINEGAEPSYHVQLAEREGEEKISGIEKFVQRDFKIGSSLGYLAAGVLAAPLAAALPIGAAAATGILVVGGALAGGISDFTRNTKEMQEGVEIKPPTRFNRDMVKSALGWSVFAKVAIGLAGLGLGAVGLPAAGAIAGTLGTVGALIGAAYGAKRGSDNGYERMSKEYEAAARKEQNPQLSVSVARNKEPVIEQAVAAAPFVGVGLSAAEQGLAQVDETAVQASQQQEAWHPANDAARRGHSFVAAEQARRAQTALAPTIRQ